MSQQTQTQQIQKQQQLHKGGFINYDEDRYCSVCEEKRDKNISRCPICNQKVRTKRHNGKNKSDKWKKKKRY